LLSPFSMAFRGQIAAPGGPRTAIKPASAQCYSHEEGPGGEDAATGPHRGLRGLQRLVRFDAAGGYEGVEVGAVEAYVPSDLRECDTPFGDEAAYEPGRRVETFGCLLDAEQAHDLVPFCGCAIDSHALFGPRTYKVQSQSPGARLQRDLPATVVQQRAERLPPGAQLLRLEQRGQRRRRAGH